MVSLLQLLLEPLPDSKIHHWPDSSPSYSATVSPCLVSEPPLISFSLPCIPYQLIIISVNPYLNDI